MYLPAILLAIAAFLTLLFVPLTLSVARANWMNSFGIVVSMLLLSILRASVMAAGFLSMTWAERSGILRPLPLCAAIFFIEGISILGHMVAATSSNHPPFRFGYEAAASAVFSVLLSAGIFAFRGSAYTSKAIWVAVTFAALAAVIGGFTLSSYESERSAAWQAEAEAARNRVERQMTALAATPSSAPIEELLPFAANAENFKVTEAAKLRIAQRDRGLEQLKAAYDGPHGAIARAIYESVAVKRKQIEFLAIPKTAGLAAVLPFNKRGESYEVLALVEARIYDTEDAENQLLKALRGPFAIEAIRALCDVRRKPLEPATYSAAFATASKIAARFDSGRPPEAQVEELTHAVDRLARQGGAPVIEKHRRELMSVYEAGKHAERRHGYSSHYYSLEKTLGLP